MTENLLDFFLPDFYFIDLEDALPGGLLPDSTDKLVFEGQSITPFLPFSSHILDTFSPEELINNLKFELINEEDIPRIKVILIDQANDTSYEKIYHIKEENAFTQCPVLEIWPNFEVEGWKRYYVFYYDMTFLASNDPDDKTFQINLVKEEENYKFREGQGTYQLSQLNHFPTCIECQDKNNNSIGLMLQKPEISKIIPPIYRWKVGVHFNPDFTNVYVNQKGIVKPLDLETLHLQVTHSDRETRLRVLTEFFIPDKFIPLDKPLPIRSILTVRQGQNTGSKRPFYDGRIYIPDENFQPQQDWIETDLKWTNRDLHQLFLSHLALHISALAAKNGVKEIQWCLSYPSTFSTQQKRNYAKTWQKITKELQGKTGIINHSPNYDDSKYFRSESLALAQYFADQEELDLVNTTCINMEDETSDISIWEASSDRFQMVHQCSVQLARLHLFTQFLEKKPRFLSDKFNVDSQDLERLRHGNFYAKFDLLLRYRSEGWLNQWDYLQDDPEFQGFIRLIAMGTAGLYYYVGTILGVLFQEGKYSRNEITPVYIGGDGSRFFNWLAIGGIFDRYAEVNELFSRMLSQASGFKDTKEVTCISKRPQDEIACGLVLDKTPLGGLDIKKSGPIVAGEYCEINGEPIEWNQYLDLQGNINSFDIPELTQLSYFLDEFNQGLIDIDADGLTPMSQFISGEGLESSYKIGLWPDVNKELIKTLVHIKGDSDNIRIEPPFILGLKALLQVLAKEWAGK